eukprot:6202169-Pleurochrysis_carterae.AAC.2
MAAASCFSVALCPRCRRSLDAGAQPLTLLPTAGSIDSLMIIAKLNDEEKQVESARRTVMMPTAKTATIRQCATMP